MLGLSAAAASLAIIGEMTPLLAEIFSMMEAVEKEVGVEAIAPSAPALEKPWLRESDVMERAPDDTADMRLAAEGGGGWRGSLGIRGKNGFGADRALLERARATGMLLGNVWDRRLLIRCPALAAMLGVGFRVWLEGEEDTEVVGVAIMWEAVVDCVVGEALRLEFLLLMVEKSTRSSLLDSSGSSLGGIKEEVDRPRTPDERMWRRSCLRL